MRIAFYAPLKAPDHPVASGDRAMARGLMAALAAAGHNVDVVSRFRSYDAGDAERQARLRAIGARWAERLIRRFDGGRPDVWFTYHLYHKAPDWLGPAITARLGIPYVLAEASFAPKQAGGPWDLGHRAVAEALQRADRIFQPNPADAECVLPLLREKRRLVPLAPFLDSASYRAPDRVASRAAASQMLQLEGEEPWLLAVAMMRDDQKLLSYRCLAVALSAMRDEPWRLVIAGDGPAADKVCAAFAPFGDRIRRIGIVEPDTLRQLYRASDIFVWPAIKEAYGIALLEAQAAGLPVVAGRSGGVPGIVADGETGLLAPEGDAEALTGRLRSLLRDPARRRAMGDAAAKRVTALHDIAQAADLLDRELRTVIGERKR